MAQNTNSTYNTQIELELKNNDHKDVQRKGSQSD